MSETRSGSFEKIPDELLVEVLFLGNFSLGDYGNFARLNKRFNTIIKDNLFWEKKFANHFPEEYAKIKDKSLVSWFSRFGITFEKEYGVPKKNINREGFKLTDKLEIKLAKKKIYWAKECNIAELKTLGFKTTDLNLCDSQGTTLLNWFINHPDQEMFNYFYELALGSYTDCKSAFSLFGRGRIISKNLNVLKQDCWGKTLLHWAIVCRMPVATIKQLIAQGADVKAVTGIGSSALHLAIKYGLTEIAQCLIDNGADINAYDADGKTPLILAIEAHQFEAVNVLIANKANIEKGQQLIENGIPTIIGDTPLHVAIKVGDEAIFRRLLAANADFNTLLFATGFNALLLAADRGEAKFAKILIESGAEVDILTSSGATPLLVAAANGREEIVTLLLNKAANVNAQLTQVTDYHEKFHLLEGDNALAAAILNGHASIVHKLLDKNTQVSSDTTAITLAATQNYPKVITVLLENGSDINTRAPGSGSTPLLVAIRNGCNDVVDFLLSKGADVNIPITRVNDFYKLMNVEVGDTPLHMAARMGNAELIKKLIERGANSSVKNVAGKTALDVAKNELCKGALQSLHKLETNQEPISEHPNQGLRLRK